MHYSQLQDARSRALHELFKEDPICIVPGKYKYSGRPGGFTTGSCGCYTYYDPSPKNPGKAICTKVTCTGHFEKENLIYEDSMPEDME